MTLREYVLAARRAFAAEDALRALQDTATPVQAKATVREYIVARGLFDTATELLGQRRRNPDSAVVADVPDTD